MRCHWSQSENESQCLLVNITDFKILLNRVSFQELFMERFLCASTVLNTSCAVTHKFSPQPYEMDAVIIPTLQMRKLRHTMVKSISSK